MIQELDRSNLAPSRLGALRPAGEEAASLLRRYPALSEVELARLINLYRGLPALDVALMLCDDELTPKIDQFSSDHRSEVRVPFRQYAVLVAIAVAGIAIITSSIMFAA